MWLASTGPGLRLALAAALCGCARLPVTSAPGAPPAEPLRISGELDGDGVEEIVQVLASRAEPGDEQLERARAAPTPCAGRPLRSRAAPSGARRRRPVRDRPGGSRRGRSGLLPGDAGHAQLRRRPARARGRAR
jgi:hypothetical protein